MSSLPPQEPYESPSPEVIYLQLRVNPIYLYRLIVNREKSNEYQWHGTVWTHDDQMKHNLSFGKDMWEQVPPPEHPERVVQ